jgi:predicted TIM-barrel fold metal-dependent hydrolase
MTRPPAPLLFFLPALLALLGCDRSPPPPAPAPAPAPSEILDVHIHLLQADAAVPLLSALDRRGVRRAVVLGSVAPAVPPGPGRFRAGNEAVLAAAAAHPDRLIPFVALEPGTDGPAELADYRRRGACGVKLYVGHQDFHDRPIDDPSFAPLYRALAEQRVPTLIHVNTVRYADELDRVLSAYPDIPLVCAHFCGARTDLGRLERLFASHPRLLVDTSGGSAQAASEGFAGLERQRDRVLSMIRAAPERFLYGSDLTASRGVGPDDAEDWDLQFSANLGLLREPRFHFWRKEGNLPGLSMGDYRGLALGPDLAGPILGGNARRWLGTCVR